LSTIAFFPWLHIAEPILLLPFRLVPYERSKLPGGSLQATLDIILEPYLETTKPLRHATLVHLEGMTLIDDLAGGQIDQCFRFRDLIALSGLACREFFGLGVRYCNRDNFILAIQDFDKESPASAISRVCRRRDGTSRTIISRSAYVVRRPAHVASNFSVTLDVSLAQALLVAQRTLTDWLRFEDAIRFFNDANSDDDQVLEQAEAVYMMSAFERLLDCRRGKEVDLVSRFVRVWRTTECVLPLTSLRASSALVAGRTLTEAWLRDFFRHRGSYAHGKLAATHPPMWPLREHLLLGSFLFPRLLKRVLASAGTYTFTERDQQEADLFEHFAREDLFTPITDSEGASEFPWDRIRQEYLWRRFHGVGSR
jgi:hypothetical protein